METLNIPYETGRIVVLGDLHLNSYDLSDLIYGFKPTAWFFGHSHRRLQAIVGETEVRNISIG